MEIIFEQQLNITAQNTLSAALVMAEQGIFVSPGFGVNNAVCGCKNPACFRPGKHPFIQERPNYASLDQNEIIDMWDQSELNLIVHTGRRSNLLVIDIDHRDGGLETYYDELSGLALFQSTFAVTTGSGGIHFYFRCFEPVESRKDGIAPGIDICGDATQRENISYVVGPYSKHVSGGMYKPIEPKPVMTITPKDIERISAQAKKRATRR